MSDLSPQSETKRTLIRSLSPTSGFYEYAPQTVKPPGKLPLVRLWKPETVYYEGDVVAYDGGTFQAKRDTGQPPSHADWICLATAGRDGNSITVRGTFNETQEYRRL